MEDFFLKSQVPWNEHGYLSVCQIMHIPFDRVSIPKDNLNSYSIWT